MTKRVISVLVTFLMLLCVPTTSYAKEQSKSIKIDSKNLYSETDFSKEMSKVKNNNVTFAENGKSDFVIVYPVELEKINLKKVDGKLVGAERYKSELFNSVKFLAKSLKSMIGCDFSLINSDRYKGEKAIKLTLDKTLIDVNEQGYYLNINENEIIISATTYQGITNGIFSFMEDELGCMFVSADFDYIPKLPTINFEKIEKIHNPDIMWRAVYSYEAEQQGKEYFDWHSKLKLNGVGFNDCGNWCHTFYTYISPEEYFESHPEYFSEYNGKRKTENGPVSSQLCLTNEKVYEIISTKLFKMMEEQPDVHIWDVSQMDTWEKRGTGCQCKNCKKLDDAQGTPMGSLLTFINRLADECAEKFPDNYISTLAYNYSAQPPKTLTPRKNVIIKLCLMPGDGASDYQDPTSKQAKKANKIVTDWSKISDNIIIWDYNVDFHKYLMPYPILTPMKNNNNFYINNNVYGIFHQMDWDKGGDNAQLNSYLFAKLMWDKNTNVEETISKYAAVYYKEAAPYIIDYLNLINENVYKANKNLYIYSKVEQHQFDYLSRKNLNKYLEIFNKAENAANSPEVVERIKQAKLGVLYTKSELFSMDKKSRINALNEFKEICQNNQINSMYEGEDGSNEMLDFYNRNMSEVKATYLIAVSTGVAAIIIVGGFVVLSKKIKQKKKNNHNK